MAMTRGSCRFGLWFVEVDWEGTTVHRVRFTRSGVDGPVPREISRYCAGLRADCTVLTSPAARGDGMFPRIYREVRSIPNGCTATYGEIARRLGTSPRAVGMAMRRNPTPLVVPCHRVVAADGLGGFTPDISIKRDLLTMEQKQRVRTKPRTDRA